ncbi:MAG: hypothetical protein V5A52_01580 [Halovenus sp.]
MGILQSVLGSGSEESKPTKRKYAVLLNAGPDSISVAGNGFNYALELADEGFEVELFLDGEATNWPAEFVENPDRPYDSDWERIQRKGLIAGVYGYCANAFDVVEECKSSGVGLLGEETNHAPSVPELAKQNYGILTVG